jgi:hypothetical protein
VTEPVVFAHPRATDLPSDRPRKIGFSCVCSWQLVTIVRPGDKAGAYCEKCSQVYDVWYDGKVDFMPLPSGAGITQKGVLSGPGYTRISVQ